MLSRWLIRWHVSRSASHRTPRNISAIGRFVGIYSLGTLLAGDPLLHPALALEGLGGWQDSCPYDGSRHRPLLRGGEKAKEENAARLPLGEPTLSQLVGL